MDCSMLGFPVHHQLLEFALIHVHQVSDAIQPSHPLFSPSPPALNLSQDRSLSQWLSSPHQVAKVLEFQLQHQSFQWIFSTNFLFFFFYTSILFYLFIFLLSFYFSNFILFLNLTILYWFCQISKWICHRYTCVPHPEPFPLGCLNEACIVIN